MGRTVQAWPFLKSVHPVDGYRVMLAPPILKSDIDQGRLDVSLQRSEQENATTTKTVEFSSRQKYLLIYKTLYATSDLLLNDSDIQESEYIENGFIVDEFRRRVPFIFGIMVDPKLNPNIVARAFGEIENGILDQARPVFLKQLKNPRRLPVVESTPILLDYNFDSSTQRQDNQNNTQGFDNVPKSNGSSNGNFFLFFTIFIVIAVLIFLLLRRLF